MTATTQLHPTGAGSGQNPGPRALLGAIARKAAVTVVASAMAVSMTLVGTSSATADTAPVDPAEPQTVSADALPTVQIDGVVWQQIVVGNTVYVAGSFTTARPAGSAPGVNTVPRNNILAYDIRTGVLINSFAPNLNGQALSLAASPDGSRIYVGGSFTSVNGATVWRIAALDATTGNLLTNFVPKMDASVRAITVTNDTVYVGGLFTGVGGVARSRLAAFSPTDGSLKPWAPVANIGQVNALALSPDGTKMVIGGSFTTLNGSNRPGYGLGAVDATTGANLPFPINDIVRNGDTGGSITSLTSNGTNVYGSGYTFGRTSTLEGMFSVRWSDFSEEWIEDCHGDTYSAFAAGDVIYAAGHSHYCGNVGGFPQEAPWDYHRAVAFSRNATGVLTDEAHGYTNFAGNPAPTLLNWFPYILDGTYTGQNQGAWSVSGNTQYLTYGGEFPTVNGAAQQGLVRFAAKSIAPNKRGPKLTGSLFNPTVNSTATGTVRLRWQANWDEDNRNLTYQVLRDTKAVYTTSLQSTFWDRPAMTFVDTGLVPGRSYGYRISAMDPSGNVVKSDTVTITAASTDYMPSTYEKTVIADAPANFWRLGEAAPKTGFDSKGPDDVTASTGVSFGVPGAISGDASTAVHLGGTTAGIISDPTRAKRPNTFSSEAWFRSTSTTGGAIISFGNALNTLSDDVDRVVYMTNDGRINFGVAPLGVKKTVGTTTVYNDGQWHHVVASLGSGGMALYLDGAKVAGRTDVTTGQSVDSYWRVGGDNLNGWSSRPTSRYFLGDVDEVALYTTALPADAVNRHFTVGTSGTAVNLPPAAKFTSAASALAATFDATTSTDSDGTIAGYAWDFGDGATGNGATASHTYAAAGTFAVKLTVTDDKGATGTVTQNVTVAPAPPNAVPTAAFTSKVTGLTAAVDGGGSKDSDGTIASYAWDFGDGATGTGATASRTYQAAGTYAVKLTVTDDKGATGTVTQNVTVTAPANAVPVAAFTSSVTGLTAAVDGGGSKDSDGTIASYAWDFGDGATGTGATASRTYAVAGTYPVKLTVTDDKGATGTVTQNVTVAAAPGSGVLAADTFGRTLASGFGSAETGGAWSLNGSASLFAVTNGAGSIRMSAAGAGPSAYLNAVSSSRAETSVSVRWDKVADGGGTFAYVIGRKAGTGEYRAKAWVSSTGQ
ncbi:MAG: hypothetical protein JWO93_2827, partial [Micrococcaceae bacterium]|nr:hypothetical protein [Micrococcaceae bacterium]